MGADISEIFFSRIEALRKEKRIRTIPSQGEYLFDLCSNDYLGLARRYHDEWQEVAAGSSPTSSASRLLASVQEDAHKLEKRLTDLYGRPALLFNSGYHVNTGCISALSQKGSAVVTDKLVHASIIDGVRLGKGENYRFRHNDVEHLRKILERVAHEHDYVTVAVESIYSMDGDVAPLEELVSLKSEFDNVLLYVDEAHAIGVAGNRGLGVCEQLGIIDKIDVLVATFGKALASCGAFVSASEMLRDYFLNTARSFIFSTALPPACHAWTLRMIEKSLSLEKERCHLSHISKLFRIGIENICGVNNVSRSQIVPLITGSSESAILLSQKLLHEGVNVLPIRRPTVPAGTERLRFSLNATLTESDIAKILDMVKRSL